MCYLDERQDAADLPHTEWQCEECGAINSCLDGQCQFCGGPPDDDTEIDCAA